MATILVVDDHPENREFMKTLLAYQGHEVLESRDGAEAFELARRNHPDLVISDILMPVMDGYELARKIHNDPSLESLPLIFWTVDHLERETAHLAEQAGALGVLRKPSDPSEIMRVVDQALHRPQDSPLSQAVRESAEVRPAPLAHDETGWANLRLNALIRAIRTLSKQSEPASVVAVACQEAREVVGSLAVMAAILGQGDGEFEQVCLCGAEMRITPEICKKLVRAVWTETAVRGLRTVRLNRSGLEACGGLGTGESMDSFLAVPIESPEVMYGWMCFIDKMGADRFTPEDERVAGAFASQMAIVYESARLQSEIGDLNARLKEQVALLKHANADLEQFGYAVSHDLKEPLRAVYGFADILLRKYGESSDPDARECLEFIRRGIERVRAMIDGLRAFYRSGTDTRGETADPEAVLRQVLENCSASIDQSGASVTQNALLAVAIPPTALLQIFQNIISNALKYRHPERSPHVHVSARQMDGFVEFAVRDNGIGIAPEHRERIFGLFQRLDPDGESSGLGLGLAMCARLVQNQGGRIWVEAAADGGSVFLFILPAPPVRDAGQTAAAG